MMTAGAVALPSDVKVMVIRRVATFSAFTADNDPHQEQIVSLGMVYSDCPKN